MRKEYDFLKMRGRKNPYAKRLKKQVALRIRSPALIAKKGSKSLSVPGN